MSNNTVSVIIPTYNSVSSLKLSIESALLQTLRPHQIIVINDGSTDNTSVIAKSYGDRITYLEQENQGQGAARNEGLSIATGRFIAFLDADDYWKPEFLDKCVDFLLEYEEAVAVSTGLIIKLFNGEEHIKPSFICNQKMISKPTVLENFFQFWAEHDHVRTGSNVIRRNIVEKAGYQRADLRVSQDLEYWGYIATFGKWGFIPEPLWVGNSRAATLTPGWLAKYRQRRLDCPTVESWEKRILPRLMESEMSFFSVIRGRVAAGYAHNKILAGYSDEALKIVKKYGDTMPHNRMTRFLRLCANLGNLLWICGCQILRVKEIVKAMKLRMTYRGTNG